MRPALLERLAVMDIHRHLWAFLDGAHRAGRQDALSYPLPFRPISTLSRSAALELASPAVPWTPRAVAHELRAPGFGAGVGWALWAHISSERRQPLNRRPQLRHGLKVAHMGAFVNL